MYLLSASYPLFSRAGFMNPWPNAAQTLLLQAALAEPEIARAAWRQWCTGHWPHSASDAGAYALMGLLCTRLPQLGETPAPLAARLREVHRYQLMRNQLSLLGLRQTLALFAQQGIPVLLFKGMPLMERAYGDWGARLISDLDLLVTEDRVEDTHAMLMAAGFSNAQRPDLHHRSVNHAASYTRAGYPSIDLHWRPFMMDTAAAAEAGLWARATARTLGGVSVLLPAAEDLLLLCCLHGRKPMPTAVTRWVADAALLLRQIGPVDWPALQARAAAAGLEAPLREAQGYLHDHFQLAPAPASRVPAPSPLAGRLIWQCCEALKRLTSTKPETGLARAVGVLRRMPYALTYNLLKFWWPRHCRGLTTGPLTLLHHLWKARQTHAATRSTKAATAQGSGVGSLPG